MLAEFARVSDQLSEILASLETENTETASLDEIRTGLGVLRDIRKQGRSTAFVQEAAMVRIGNEMSLLAETDKTGRVRSLLRRLHPFLTQGSSYPGEQFLVINDEELTVESRDPERLTQRQANYFLVSVFLPSSIMA